MKNETGPDTDKQALGPRVEKMINSKIYRRADQDVDFLNENALRGPRLELDYLKPEKHLREQGVEQTIVVFGGTRIPEPAAAKRNLEKLRNAVESEPGDHELRDRLRLAERVMSNTRYYEIAREFGAIVGRSGAGPDDTRVTLMTGGGPGIMEAANRGAFEVGAKSIGLNITLPHEQYPNPYISEELCLNVRYFAIRKLHFLMRARALVVFPGGFGTFDELFETLTLVQTRKIEALPVILVGNDFWQKAFDPDFLVDEGVIDPGNRDLFSYAETAQEIWDAILHWHTDETAALLCEARGNC